MQFSSNIPPGICFSSGANYRPTECQNRLWGGDGEAEQNGDRFWNLTALLSPPNMISFISYLTAPDIIDQRPLTLTEQITSASYIFQGSWMWSCSSIWRLPETPSLENKWEPHLSQAGVGHRDTNRRKEGEAKADGPHWVICGLHQVNAKRKSTALRGQVKSSLQILGRGHPPLQNPKPLQSDPFRDCEQTTLRRIQCKVVGLIFTLLDWGE